MGLSYNKLWHLLLDRKINKTYLRKNGVHSTTIAKMSKNEPISSETIEKICEILSVQPGDIVEYISNSKVGD